MKLRTITYILLSALVINSCEILYPCLEGNGVLETQERTASSFSSVSSSGNFDVEVLYGEEHQVIVDADENLQQYIRAYVEDGELIIETELRRCLQSSNRILVTVICPYIETIVLSGSGDIDVSDFTSEYNKIILNGSGDINCTGLNVTQNLDVELTGSGDITIEGKTVASNYYLSGSGDIHANLMKSNSCDIVLSGSGDIFTYVYDYLKVVLSGSGNVYYYGNPTNVDERVTGSGNLIKK